MLIPEQSTLVVGPGKSGTTALFYAIKEGAERHHGHLFKLLFEPKTVSELVEFVTPFSLVKMLQERVQIEDIHNAICYDKRIYILRDPRDNIISRLTWRSWSALDPNDLDARAEVIEIFKEKERSPQSVSVIRMFDTLSSILRRNTAARAREASIAPLEILNANISFFLLKYEQFVQGEMGNLSGYLGYKVGNSPNIGQRHAHVHRKGSFGDWKNWFTSEDVDYFVTPHRREYNEMGYDPDEIPNTDQIIAPEFCSGFLSRQFSRQDETISGYAKGRAEDGGLTPIWAKRAGVDDVKMDTGAQAILTERLKVLEEENVRLKLLLAERVLNFAALKERPAKT